MLAYPPPLSQVQTDGLRFRHAFLDGITQFAAKVSYWIDGLTLDSLRLAQSILDASNKALHYRINRGNLSVNETSYLFGQKRIVYDLSIACGLQQNVAGNGYTLSASQSALAAISLFQAWDPVLQTNPQFNVMSSIDQVYAGLTFSLGGQTNPTTQTEIDYLYTIEQLDDLPMIAERLTGNASNWQQIAEYNRLREPYISNNPADWYGPVLTQGTFGSQMSSGVKTIALTNANAKVITEGVLLFVETITTTGTVVYETQSVASFDANTYTVTLSNGLVYTYPKGATWMVFPNPMDVTTKVLPVGGVLHIPGVLVQNQNLVTTHTDYLGTDIALTQGQVNFSGGDLQTVTGPSNLRQALQNRFKTPYGALPYHPQYGNKMLRMLGEMGQPHFATMAKLYIKETAMQDPRVSDVTNETFTQQGTGGKVNAQIQINNSKSALTLEVAT